MAEAARTLVLHIAKQITRDVGTPDGLDQKTFVRWLRELDNYQDQATELATLTSKGKLRDAVHEKKTGEWKTIKAHLLSTFSGPQHAENAYQKLSNLTQAASDTVAQYADKITRLTAETYNKMAPEQEQQLVNGLINGLQSGALAQVIFSKEPQTVAELVDHLLENQYKFPSRSGKQRVCTVEDLEKLGSSIQSEIQKGFKSVPPGPLDRQVQGQNPPPSLKTNLTPQVKQTSSAIGANKWVIQLRNATLAHQTRHVLDVVHITGYLIAHKRLSFLEIRSQKTSTAPSQCPAARDKGLPTGRPRVRVSVNGLQQEALVDTGSTTTLMSSRLYDKLPHICPLGAGPTIYGLGRQELEVRGATMVRIGDVTHKVVVLKEMEYPLLLGVDFLKMCVIDLPQSIIVIGSKKYPLIRKQEFSNESFKAQELPECKWPNLKIVLEQYADLFVGKSQPVKATDQLTPATIETTGPPIRQRSYRLPMAKQECVEKEVSEMLKDGIIRPSDSPWASPIVLVGKKDGSTRFCVDYRKLNAVTTQDAHPLPHIQEIFDNLRGAKIFSTLDLKSGYWQIPVDKASIPKTAFTCHLGLFEFVRMPFGLTNAPAIFQRAMTKALQGLVGKICMVYIDDIIVYSQNEKQHAKDLEAVFQRLKQFGLQLKPSKCEIGKDQLDLLGYIISAQGIQPQPEKIEAISQMEPPTTVKGVQSFMGMVNYYRQFIPNMAEISAPLTNLTKKYVRFEWTLECQEAFEQLKQALTQAPVLAHPDLSKPYILYTDASATAVGGILVQEQEGTERVIAYVSHKFTGAAQNWSAIEKEAYAVLYSLKKFHCYLYGAKFEIHTDHKPLKSLFQDEQKNSKLQRWAIQIAEYGAPILYHPGKLNVRADMLSRISVAVQTDNTEPPSQIPDIWQADEIDVQDLGFNNCFNFQEKSRKLVLI